MDTSSLSLGSVDLSSLGGSTDGTGASGSSSSGGWSDPSTWTTQLSSWGQSVNSVTSAVKGVAAAFQGPTGPGKGSAGLQPLPAAPLSSQASNISPAGTGFFAKLAASIGVPVWAAVTILVGGVIVVLALLYKLFK